MTSITTRETTGGGATVKDAPLTNAEIDNNFISIVTSKLEASQNLSDITDAAAARANLGIDDVINALGSLSTQDSDSVDITGGTIAGITDLTVNDGGTGASTASGARTNLGLGSLSTQDSDSVNITGGTITGITDINISDGGTGASTASGARTNLGLGSIATQDSNFVDITGGTITGITDLRAAGLETARNIFGQSFDGTSDVSGNITFGTQTNKATLTYNINEPVTLSVPDLSGSRTLAFIDESQTFTNEQTFSGNVSIDSLGVGAAASGTTGEIRASGNIIANFSDGRLKTNVHNIDSALDKVLSINGVTYDSSEIAKEYGFYDSNQVGLIAQEVEKILPQVVKNAPFDTSFDDDGNQISISGKEYKTIQYEKIIPLLVEAVKELSAEIKKYK